MQRPVAGHSFGADRLAWAGVLTIVLAAVLSVSFGNGTARPLDGHEIFVAESATQMLAHGEYWVPEFNGHVRLQKPPLAYWLAAGVHEAAGRASPVVDELEARVPSLVAGGLLVVLTFVLGRSLFGDVRIGWLGAGVFATCFDFFDYARSARPEMLYALFCVALVVGIATAWARAREGRSTLAAGCLASFALCGSLLAKGPQLPAFLLLAAGLALHTRGREHPKWRILRPDLLALGLVPALVYFGVVAARVDGAAAVWAREMVQDKPIPLLLRPLRFYFPATLVMGLLPWVAGVALAGLQSWRRREHPGVFLLAACVVVSLFGLGFSGKLRHHYVLPLVPLVAVLIGFAFVSLYDEARENARVRRWLRVAVTAQAGLMGGLIVAAAVQAWMLQPPFVHVGTGRLLPWLVTAVVVLVAGVWRWRVGDPGVAALLGVLAVSLVWLGAAVAGADANPRWILAKRFALEVRALAGPSETIYFDSGERSPLVYYGRFRLAEWHLGRWKLDRDPLAPPPRFVCQRERPAAVGIPGEIIAAQPLEGRSDRMILFHPTPPESAPVARAAPAAEPP